MMPPRSEPESSNSLLGPEDPPPVEILDGGGAPIVLVCDHASAALPKSLGSLGLGPADLSRHIAIDIGAASLTRRLARAFDAQAVFAGYSRLVIDCNRDLDDHTSIREISEGAVIAGNRGLSEGARRARAAAVFHPYHAAITECLDGHTARGSTPAVVAVHSFTPVYRGLDRPWHVGILSGRDRRIADPLIAALSARKELAVGDNQPYSGREFAGYTIDVHAMALGFPNVMIEIRQDLAATESDIERWSDILRAALAPILEDRALYAELRGT